jgi:3-dehydroquinate synthase
LTDKNVKRHVYPRIKSELPAHKLLVLPAGEEGKRLDVLGKIWAWLSEQGADRQSVIVALGGGAVSDVAGFAAATYMRGIRWVAMPTTFLAMVDAAYGGKTAINVGDIKNLAGAFHAPQEVIVKPEFLETLPYGELLSGWAEVLKHTLLHSEKAWKEFRVEECDSPAVWPYAIALSQEVKGNIVAQDPTEQGLRRALNLGHTIGHALESFYLHKGTPILHGQAVALGLLAEVFLATEQGFCVPEGLAQVEETILSQYPLLPFEKSDIPQLVKLLRHDKKRFEGKHRYVALTQPGTYNINGTFTDAEARKAFAMLM